jgi:N6-L-threonylcarbamoyladenine synthase
MKILAIETSCDDTGIAILEVTEEKKSASSVIKVKFKILGNEVSSQIDIHKEYGGVFPALAKREHIKNLPLVLAKVLKASKIKEENLQKEIDAIAITTGPGLEPALWTGIVFAKELNEKYKIPIVPVNHMEGHIFSVFPKDKKTFIVENKKENFPMLSLLVSGGHTELVFMKDWMKYKKIGSTRDDAAGEAFDKVARMLGLPYPGGPEISRLADIKRSKIAGIERKYVVPGSLTQDDGPSTSKKPSKVLLCADGNNILSEIPTILLPRPMIYSKDYDFSFSGLKTAVLYLIRDLKLQNPNILDDENIKQKIAREFEDATVETLVHKTVKAIKEYKIKTLIVGGGVSANKYLQEQMKEKIKENKLKTKIHFPSKALTGDNALMIAIAGYFQAKNKKFVKNSKSLKLKADGNMTL